MFSVDKKKKIYLLCFLKHGTFNYNSLERTYFLKENSHVLFYEKPTSVESSFLNGNERESHVKKEIISPDATIERFAIKHCVGGECPTSDTAMKIITVLRFCRTGTFLCILPVWLLLLGALRCHCGSSEGKVRPTLLW